MNFFTSSEPRKKNAAPSTQAITQKRQLLAKRLDAMHVLWLSFPNGLGTVWHYRRRVHDPYQEIGCPLVVWNAGSWVMLYTGLQGGDCATLRRGCNPT